MRSAAHRVDDSNKQASEPFAILLPQNCRKSLLHQLGGAKESVSPAVVVPQDNGVQSHSGVPFDLPPGPLLPTIDRSPNAFKSGRQTTGVVLLSSVPSLGTPSGRSNPGQYRPSTKTGSNGPMWDQKGPFVDQVSTKRDYLWTKSVRKRTTQESFRKDKSGGLIVQER